MYRKVDPRQIAFEDLYLPFGGKLYSDNRWIILAKQIPWEQVEEAYTGQFSKDDMGAPAKASRMAFGALIIKERLGVSDRELVEQISENPYLQYFLRLSGDQKEASFHHSMLTHFRKRFSQEALAEINAAIAKPAIDMENKAEASGTKEDPKGHRQTVGLFETEPACNRQDDPSGRSGRLEPSTIQKPSRHPRA